MVIGQKKNPCRSCSGLLVSSENDSPPAKPHEYLVAVGTRTDGGSVRYACLLCNTALERSSNGGKWSEGD